MVAKIGIQIDPEKTSHHIIQKKNQETSTNARQEPEAIALA